jgi:translation initiation factor IF-3
MFGLNDYQVKREQHNDFLRRADKARLINSLTGRREHSSLFEGLREFFAEKIEDSKHSSLVMKLRNAH